MIKSNPENEDQLIQQWWSSLEPGERLWRFDIGHYKDDHIDPSKSAFREGGLELARAHLYDRFGLGSGESALSKNVGFVNRSRKYVARGSQTDRLVIQGSLLDLTIGPSDWISHVALPAINTPFAHENDYVFDWEECADLCDELPEDRDINLIADREVMETLWTPEGDIAYRLFFSADNPEDAETVNRAVRIQAALDQLLVEERRIKGVRPPGPWPHDDLNLPIKI